MAPARYSMLALYPFVAYVTRPLIPVPFSPINSPLLQATETMTTVLIIDDDHFVRDSICDLLLLEGFQTLTADKGTTGLQLAIEHHPDLILCDVQIPDLDGYDLLKRLRQNHLTQAIPFIFLSARAAKTDLRLGMNLGADDYLTKPCSAADLLEAINSRLSKHDALQSQTQQELENLRSSITLALPHELRTPLTGIVTSVELLRLLADAPTKEDLLEIADTIQSSSQKLYRLIQNYLLYAKLEVTSHDPALLATFQQGAMSQPNHIVATVAAQVAQQYDRGGDLLLDLAADAISQRIRCTGADLEKILSELIDNAFKFSGAGTVVYVKSWVEEPFYGVEITDIGRGMTEEHIALLGAYIQFDRRIYEQYGVGLGFAIAKRLVELWQGRILVKSQPNGGTTVRVSLLQVPLAHTEAQEFLDCANFQPQ